MITENKQYYIGCSGWNYKHWKGLFYPETIPQYRWLQYYASIFTTVEINATFYRQFKDATYTSWYNRVNNEFCYSLKLSRYITHVKRLLHGEDAIQRCVTSASLLKDKLGVIVIQLPPSLKFDEQLVGDFLLLLPSNYRYAIEARHGSWLCDSCFSLLQQHNIAWCIADTASRYPYHEVVTANFVYIRLHGSKKLYASEYTMQELEEWANKIIAWDKITYCYFDNDVNAYAVFNALSLKRLLHVTSPLPCSEFTV